MNTIAPQPMSELDVPLHHDTMDYRWERMRAPMSVRHPLAYPALYIPTPYFTQTYELILYGRCEKERWYLCV